MGLEGPSLLPLWEAGREGRGGRRREEEEGAGSLPHQILHCLHPPLCPSPMPAIPLTPAYSPTCACPTPCPSTPPCTLPACLPLLSVHLLHTHTCLPAPGRMDIPHLTGLWPHSICLCCADILMERWLVYAIYVLPCSAKPPLKICNISSWGNQITHTRGPAPRLPPLSSHAFCATCLAVHTHTALPDLPRLTRMMMEQVWRRDLPHRAGARTFTGIALLLYYLRALPPPRTHALMFLFIYPLPCRTPTFAADPIFLPVRFPHTMPHLSFLTPLQRTFALLPAPYARTPHTPLYKHILRHTCLAWQRILPCCLCLHFTTTMMLEQTHVQCVWTLTAAPCHQRAQRRPASVFAEHGYLWDGQELRAALLLRTPPRAHLPAACGSPRISCFYARAPRTRGALRARRTQRQAWQQNAFYLCGRCAAPALAYCYLYVQPPRTLRHTAPRRARGVAGGWRAARARARAF